MCPCGLLVDEEHFLRGECSIPPAWFQAIIVAGEYDVRHRSGHVTTSQILGCPRAAAFKRLGATPQIVERLTPASIGTGLHELMSRQGVLQVGQETLVVPEGCNCNHIELMEGSDFTAGNEGAVLHAGEWHQPWCHKALNTYTGLIDGVPVSGRSDFQIQIPAWSHKIVLGDYKFRSPYAKRKKEPSNSDLLQLNINAELARQTRSLHGPNWDVLGLQRFTAYFYDWAGKEDSYLPLLPIGDVLDSTVSYGPANRTVRELLHLTARAQKLATVEEVVAEIPAIGEQQFGGDKCRKYCEFYYVCNPDRLGV